MSADITLYELYPSIDVFAPARANITRPELYAKNDVIGWNSKHQVAVRYASLRLMKTSTISRKPTIFTFSMRKAKKKTYSLAHFTRPSFPSNKCYVM